MSLRILEHTPAALAEALVEAGFPAYRAKQLLTWVYTHGVTQPAEMANVPKALRDELTVLTSRVVDRVETVDGVSKLLLEYADGSRVETVAIPDGKRLTACLSTQVGCAVGCRFCASGLEGVQRDLTGGEILEQALHIQQAAGRPLTNTVFMGSGEPLANYDATVFAVRGLIDEKRFALSARKVTVSTVGLPRAIEKLAAEDLPITLALSLHAPNDALRRKLIPAAAGVGLDRLVEAGRTFYKARHREVTLEYILLAGVNDSPACAAELAELAGRLRCNVNLIGYNPVDGLPYVAPSQAAVERFATTLRQRGVNAHVRRSRGLAADAACGQLRRRHRPPAEPSTQDRR